jgi:large subunit ribosomal protein L3
VFKGKKMAGHMGAKRITMLNLEVIQIDTENNLIFVRGGVPGAENAYVRVRDSIKNKKPKVKPVVEAKADKKANRAA